MRFYARATDRPDPYGERLLDPHLPRALLRHLAETPEATVRTVDATILLWDVSGFTKLSEPLARRGHEGAEELVEAIGDRSAVAGTVGSQRGQRPRRRSPL